MDNTSFEALLSGNNSPAPKVKQTRKRKAKAIPPPDFLSDVAKSKWAETLVRLSTLGNDGALDLDVLTMYAIAYADVLFFDQDIKDQKGRLDALAELDLTQLQNRKAYDLVNNQYKSAIEKKNRSMVLVMNLGDKLGLNPSSRRKIKASQETANPFEDYLK